MRTLDAAPIRVRILQTQNGRCLHCDKKDCRSEVFTLDHIIPRAWGGTNADENLQVLCSTCNRRKQIRENQLHFSKNKICKIKAWNKEQAWHIN